MGVAELRQAIKEPAQPTTGVAALKGAKPPLTTAQKIVRGGAGSMIGGALGGVGGVFAAPFTAGVINPVTGAMIGSAGGEALTQYGGMERLPGVGFETGVTEPSLVQIALAGLLPMVPPVARRFFTSLPGAAAGAQQFLLKSLGDKGQRVIAQVAPVPGTVDALFAQARASGVTLAIPMTATTAAVAKASKEVAKSKYAPGQERLLITQSQAFTESGPVSFDDFRINQVDLGARVRALARKRGPGLGRATQILDATWDDLNVVLNQLPSGQTGELLRRGIDAYKREKAAEILKTLFITSRRRRIGQLNFDADAFIDKLDRRREALAKFLPDDEIDDVIKLMTTTKLGRPGITAVKIPTMAKTPQLGFETMPFAARAVVGAAIGGGVEAAGGGVGVVGAATGILATEALSVALTTAPGRALVQSMLRNGLTWDQAGTLLLQGGRTAFTPGDKVRLDNPDLKQLLK